MTLKLDKTKILTTLVLGSVLTACVQPHENTNMDESLSLGNPLPTEVYSVPNLNSVQPVTQPVPNPLEKSRVVKESIYQSNDYPYPEVVRYDRYTLVSSSPIGGQKYLLEQLVNVDMLGKRKQYTLTVEQGLWNTLKDTGYSLCYVSPIEVNNLFKLPLPKIHYKFGPMRLRDALQMLAGEAYELTVNDAKREICFISQTVLPTSIEAAKPLNYAVKK